MTGWRIQLLKHFDLGSRLSVRNMSLGGWVGSKVRSRQLQLRSRMLSWPILDMLELSYAFRGYHTCHMLLNRLGSNNSMFVCTRLFLLWFLSRRWWKRFELLRFPWFCPVADLLPWRKRLEIPDKKLSPGPENTLCDIPECLSQLKRLINNTFLLFVISDLGVTLYTEQ